MFRTSQQGGWFENLQKEFKPNGESLICHPSETSAEDLRVAMQERKWIRCPQKPSKTNKNVSVLKWKDVLIDHLKQWSKMVEVVNVIRFLTQKRVLSGKKNIYRWVHVRVIVISDKPKSIVNFLWYSGWPVLNLIYSDLHCCACICVWVSEAAALADKLTSWDQETPAALRWVEVAKAADEKSKWHCQRLKPQEQNNILSASQRILSSEPDAGYLEHRGQISVKVNFSGTTLCLVWLQKCLDLAWVVH